MDVMSVDFPFDRDFSFSGGDAALRFREETAGGIEIDLGESRRGRPDPEDFADQEIGGGNVEHVRIVAVFVNIHPFPVEAVAAAEHVEREVLSSEGCEGFEHEREERAGDLVQEHVGCGIPFEDPPGFGEVGDQSGVENHDIGPERAFG